jgi:hypothetical protein
MQKEILSIRSELCFSPTGGSTKSIEITKNDAGSYTARFKGRDDTGEKVTIEKQLATNEIEAILGELRDMQIPAFPEHDMGCDGGFTELMVGGYDGRSHFRWWSVPPPGWEPLEEIVGKIVMCSGMEKLF